MNAFELVKRLNFDEFDYFYHETSKGNSKIILEDGLLIDGTNNTHTFNILFTVASPLTKELVDNENIFRNFLQQRKNSGDMRNISELVILGAPKEDNQILVSLYGEYIDDIYYAGIVDSWLIVGFIDLETLEFYPNKNYEYGEEIFIGDRK